MNPMYCCKCLESLGFVDESALSTIINKSYYCKACAKKHLKK